MIELRNITKVFQQKKGEITALAGVSLHVPKGKIYGVIGASGAGKSTLIQQTIRDTKVKDKVKVGAGTPITTKVECYEGDIIRVFDSPGYESGESSQQSYQNTRTSHPTRQV